MRRWRVILVVAATVALAFCGLALSQQILWIGSYELTIHVENRGPTIRAVSCETFGEREYAEQSIEYFLRPRESRSVVVDPYQGEPIKLRVTLTGSDLYRLGIELSRYHDHYLAVIATYADGRRVGQIVEIPDSRKSKEVRVVFE
jgi:hypothetical protein